MALPNPLIVRPLTPPHIFIPISHIFCMATPPPPPPTITPTTLKLPKNHPKKQKSHPETATIEFIHFHFLITICANLFSKFNGSIGKASLLSQNDVHLLVGDVRFL